MAFRLFALLCRDDGAHRYAEEADKLKGETFPADRLSISHPTSSTSQCRIKTRGEEQTMKSSRMKALRAFGAVAALMIAAFTAQAARRAENPDT